MEVHRTTTLRQLLAGISASLLFAGCSDSSAYVEYASLPTPAAVDAVESIAGPVKTVVDGASADESLIATPNDADSGIDQTAGNQPDTTAPTPKSSGVDEAAGRSMDQVVPAVAASSDQPEIALTSAETSVTRELPQALPTDQDSTEKDTASAPKEIKLLIPDKRFQTEGDQQAVRISYDDFDLLKVLNMEPVPVDAVGHFPEWLKNLHGKRVRLRGFMFPTFKATGLTGFSLARDNGICCFGRDPLIYDILEVDLAEGETTDYIEAKAFDVEGVFQIDPEADDTELFQLYRIEDARVLK